jgi:hypothetical protein
LGGASALAGLNNRPSICRGIALVIATSTRTPPDAVSSSADSLSGASPSCFRIFTGGS